MGHRATMVLISAAAAAGMLSGIGGIKTEPAVAAVGLIVLSAIVVALAQQTIP